jgi:hypothetical protein
MNIGNKTPACYIWDVESRMMNERQVQAARKLIRLKSWRWVPGMLGVRDCPPDKRDYLQPEVRIKNIRDADYANIYKCIPDLSDPATIGALLQLVRVVAKDERVYLCDYDGYDSVEWGVISTVIEKLREELDLKPSGWFRVLIGDASTEGEALAVALQTAEEFYAKKSNDSGPGE